MLTSKQRSTLRAMSNSLQSVTQIGKNGINDALIQSLDKTLESRELIKVTVLETALISAKEALEEVAEKLNAEPVLAVGSKFVLYRPSKKDPQIQI
ncbi:MAG: YhbY family RNA-binding protein [Clostridia bacterium]